MSPELVGRALREPGLVQSFSGVRARFGEGPEIPDELAALAVAYGFCYSRLVLEGRETADLVVGRDPRPTGQRLAESLARGFLAGAVSRRARLRIVNLDIITTPLVETAVRALAADGGVMITASHNPLTDNGFKFLTGCRLQIEDDAPAGALLSAKRMAGIVQAVAAVPDDPRDLLTALGSMTEADFNRAFGDGEDQIRRVRAERAYLDEIGDDWGIQPHCLKPLTLGPALLDPNGGAACGIGARVLEHFGVRAIEVNAKLGVPEHGIDTDNIDPATGEHVLRRVARAAIISGARFGIAFDYDADRGNLVLPGTDDSAIVPPQTVAATNIALALVRREMMGKRSDKLAVVISDSTSGASADVAKMFGAEVHIVETGEINVVTRMSQLRREGYDVPVGVEGANGGSVFGSSTCRDGLQTAICASLGDERLALGERLIQALSRSRHSDGECEVRRLPEILSAMPRNFNRVFRLEGPAISHGEIKSRMEQAFESSGWPKLSGMFDSYEFRNYEGTGLVPTRTGDESGGWRILLRSAEKESFIFARGSRTEAGIWRIIVDSPDPELGNDLAEVAMALYEAATDSTSGR